MRRLHKLHSPRRAAVDPLQQALSLLTVRRCSSTVAARHITPAAAVLHTSIADAHIHSSCLLAELVSTRRPQSLAAYVALTEEWWRTVEQLVLLPASPEAIEDLPQYLMECTGIRPSRAATHAHRVSGAGDATAAASSEAEGEETALLEKWEEWMWSSMPRTMPAAAHLHHSFDVGSDAGQASVGDSHEVLSYPQLTSLLYSYARYHRGVQWGASAAHSSSGGAAAAAAYYRRRYLLHPWHGLACPEGRAQQMPFVHVLRWMLSGKDGEATPEQLWESHRAVEPFFSAGGPENSSLRGSSGGTGGGGGVSTSDSSRRFRALDVCSQSGHVTDLLLRAGADLVVAADADPQALGNTEATYHEHLRERRSADRGQLLRTRRCDGLPLPPKVDEAERVAAKVRQAAAAEEEERREAGRGRARVEATSATAAERRRRLARESGRGYGGVSGATATATDASMTSGTDGRADGSPFRVVYIHPPAPTVVWPVQPATPTTVTHLPRTSWWHSMQQRAVAVHGVAPHLLLPFVPCASLAGAGERRCPLSTLSGLQGVVEALRADVAERRGTEEAAAAAAAASSSTSRLASPHRATAEDVGEAVRSDALLCDDGYVVLVLPRTFDTASLLQQDDGRQQVSLGDWVVAQLDGYYDLILRRRCPAESTDRKDRDGLRLFEESLVSYARQAMNDADAMVEEQTESEAAAASSSSSYTTTEPTAAQEWRGQLANFYQREWWQEVLVLRKNSAMVAKCAAARQDVTPHLLKQRLATLRRAGAPAVDWEDSFDYNEYRPRALSAHTSHHWTDLMPTYSYLEPDFYDSQSVQRNYLAVGHSPAVSHSPSAATSVRDGGDRDHRQQQQQTGSQVSVINPATSGGVAAASAQAAANFHTLFAQELRTRRRSKLRKLALSPLERQEWYIDEKLVKSSGARVELMNELSRWDMKDYDK